ncbi:MAG: hypothetical protein ACRD2E_02475, partial [Terriglobales bacterium]
APGPPRAAGAPVEIVLQPGYASGSVYAWRLRVHSVIRRSQGAQQASATLDNRALVVMRVMSGGGPGVAAPAPAVVTLHFAQYQTTVAGFGPLAAALRTSAAATDAAVRRMEPLTLRLTPGAAPQVVALGTPPAPRQARTMLRQLLSTAGLPLGAVRPGDTWRREVIQKLPQFHTSFPLAITGRFAAWQRTRAGWQAAVHTTSGATVTLPPAAIPGFAAAAAAGYASQGQLRLDGQTDSRYDRQGILQAAQSHTRTWLRLTLVGGPPAGAPEGAGAAPVPAQPTEMRVDSTGSVRAIAPPLPPAAPPPSADPDRG